MKLLSLRMLKHPEYVAEFDTDEFMVSKTFNLTYTINDQIEAICGPSEFYVAVAASSFWEGTEGERRIFNEIFRNLRMLQNPRSGDE